MKTTLVLLVLACVMAVAYGDLICGRSYCQKNKSNCAAPVAQSSCVSPSVYKAEHTGMCGCCPACVTLLGEGAGCKTYDKELGATPTAVCRDPLRCINAVCTKIPARNKP